MRLLGPLLLLACVWGACGGDDGGAPSDTASRSPSPAASASPTGTPALSPTPVRTLEPTAPPIQLEPLGFPVDPQTRLGVVVGEVGSRQLVFDGLGPSAYDYALNAQPSDDADAANRSGWNCRTHVEYEGIAAEDLYIDIGTPLVATLDGTATLFVISYANDFDRYSVDREPYIGNPDRSRAPLAPFPAQSGGLGVYVHIENAGFVTEYGHMDLFRTVDAVPATAFVDGYAPDSDYTGLFAEVPKPRVATRIARWEVVAGEVIGMSGDAGYSEGPHVHYTVQSTDGGPLLCPTNEGGFTDGGWLFR